MLTKWFRTRSPRSPQLSHFFRPELEALEGRLAPSNMVPMHGPGNGNGNGNSHGHGGGGDRPPIAGPINQGGGVNVVGNHNNIHITNSFNNNTGFLAPTQAGAVGLLSIFGSLLALETGSSQVGTLVNDEIALAVDKYLQNVLPSGTIPSLGTDITNLQHNISGLESSLGVFGPIIGTLVYDVTYDALTAAQPTI